MISLSGGACNTMTTDPSKHMAQPNFPNVPSSSFKKYDPNTALPSISSSVLSASIENPLTRSAHSMRLTASPGLLAQTHMQQNSQLLPPPLYDISPTNSCFQVPMRIHVMIPPHHTGLFRYENPSPSNPCFALASLRPFFVMTKLVPAAEYLLVFDDRLSI